MILSLYARRMATRNIQTDLAEVYGAEVSPALVSKATDVVAEVSGQTRDHRLADPAAMAVPLVGENAGEKAAPLG